MVEFNDRRPQPYYPHRGSPEKRAQPTQGKLFADPKPADEHRYQRGYTPERMAAVHATGVEIVAGNKGALAGPSGPHRVKEAIARSTMPLEDMSPQFNGDRLGIATGSKLRGASGQHRGNPHGGHGQVDLDQGYGSGRSADNRATQTLMHELGHVSSRYHATEHTLPDTRQKQGQEEAYADDYKVTHWRPDPRDTRRGEGTPQGSPYVHAESFKNYQVQGVLHRMNGGKTAHKAYMEARNTSEPVRPARRDSTWAPQMFMEHSNEPSAVALPHETSMEERLAIKDRDYAAKAAKTGGSAAPSPSIMRMFNDRRGMIG